MLPVLKKADWRRNRKIREVRRSEVVSVRVVRASTRFCLLGRGDGGIRSVLFGVVLVIVLARDGG